MSTILPGCCSCSLNCYFETGITSGCCLSQCDTLLLWNKRPGWSVNQHYNYTSFGFPPVTTEVCYTKTYDGEDPVQSIYKFYDCFYRVQYFGAGGPVNAIDLPTSDGTFQGEACGNYVCDPTVPNPDVCCDTQMLPTPFDCLCGHWFGPGNGGISNWRKRELLKNPATKWFVETACHKDGNDLRTTGGLGAIGSLYNEALFIVYKERWWRIANQGDVDNPNFEGCTADHIVVPGGTCGTQTDDLVPKWWIFACSGIPIYEFEVFDAYYNDWITSGQYNDILDAVNLGTQPPQSALKAMARGGYFEGKDWRPEQNKAYEELNARFPGAGYAGCSMGCTGSDVLGLFRKRAYIEVDQTIVSEPFLRPQDTITELQPFQAHYTSPDCWINYPGSTANLDDFQYWGQRQWVYFSGVPGGWIWVDWTALAQCGGNCATEEEAILEGYGRGAGVGDPVNLIEAPMLAFRGEPQCGITCNNCSPICGGNTCDYCGGGCSQEGPLASCDPPAVCSRFSIHPECEGVHFVFSKYVNENDLTLVDGVCEASNRYKCMFQVHSYLTSAKTYFDYRTDICPQKCMGATYEKVFNSWEPITRGHELPSFMCGLILDPAAGYTIDDFCCGAYCTEYNYVDYQGTPGDPGDDYPCPYPGAFKGCTLSCATPPHGLTQFGGTTAQVACIGYLPPSGISGGTC
jgi:hypothetical protein